MGNLQRICGLPFSRRDVPKLLHPHYQQLAPPFAARSRVRGKWKLWAVINTSTRKFVMLLLEMSYLAGEKLRAITISSSLINRAMTMATPPSNRAYVYMCKPLFRGIDFRGWPVNCEPRENFPLHGICCRNPRIYSFVYFKRLNISLHVIESLIRYVLLLLTLACTYTVHDVYIALITCVMLPTQSV